MRAVRGLVAGRRVVGFADAGSALDPLVAVEEAGQWFVSGHASRAFLPQTGCGWVTFAVVQGVLRAFYVGKAEAAQASASRTLGLRAADIGTLQLKRAAAQPISGAKTVELWRAWTLALGFVAAGIGRAALGEGIAYAQQRVQFGKPIAHYQAIQWKIANFATELEGSQLMLRAAACPDGRPAAVARATCAATRAVTSGCSQMLQIHGGYGYTEEFAVERLYRDARAVALYAGVDERTKQIAADAIVARFCGET